MAIEKNIKINVDAKQGVKEVDKLNKGVQDTNKGARDSKRSFSIMSAGIKGVGLAFKALGVGLVVAAFTKLAEMLQQNQAVIDKVNIASAVLGDIFTKIGTVIISVVRGLGLLGKAVGKVLRGEFAEAGDLAKQSFNGVKDAVVGNSESFGDFIKNAKDAAKETAQFAKNLVNLRNEVKLAEAQQRQLQLVYQKDAEIQRQIRDDISLTFEERIAANEELGKILDKQFAEEQALAQKKIDLAALELSRNKDNIDLQVALIDAKTEMADLDERITGQRSEQLVNLKGLEKEQADAIQAAIDAENKRLADLEKSSKKRVEIAKETGEAEVKIEKLTAANKRSIIANSLGQVAQLMGEESKAGKALAVGQALINTYSAAAAALAPPPIGAGPIFGPIAAIGAIAAGMANVKSILSTKIPGVSDGGGGGGAEPAVPGGMGPLTPNMENIQAPELGGGDSQVQAFVVENDISNAQALQEELDLQATL
jgi:LAS superfamily LD-carboxypeptidase LdcB